MFDIAISYRSILNYEIISIIYVTIIILHNCYTAWSGAKKYLNLYRTKQLTKWEMETIKSEWDAVLHGANKDFFVNFLDSLIWPFKVISKIIPFIVLKLT